MKKILVIIILLSLILGFNSKTSLIEVESKIKSIQTADPFADYLNLSIQFDEGAGSSISDSSPANRTITIAGYDGDEWDITVSYNTEAFFPITIDGDQVQATWDGETIDSHGWTLGAWYKIHEPYEALTYKSIFRLYDTSGFPSSALTVTKHYQDDAIHITLTASVQAGEWKTSGNITTYEDWHFYTLTWSGNITETPKFYVDGENVALALVTTPSGTLKDCDRVDDSSGGSNFTLDTFFVYNTNVSASWIATLFDILPSFETEDTTTTEGTTEPTTTEEGYPIGREDRGAGAVLVGGFTDQEVMIIMSFVAIGSILTYMIGAELRKGKK